jgi:N-methylhydantoinase B
MGSILWRWQGGSSRPHHRGGDPRRARDGRLRDGDALSLTATTPILNQSNERNATILDARGRLAALSSGSRIHAQLDAAGAFRDRVLRREGGLRKGDVLVANDPYHGGGHLPDYNVFAPVVVDGK